MEYKLIINGIDESKKNENVEFSMTDNADKIKVTIGYYHSYIDISEFKKIEKLISLKEQQWEYTQK